MQQTDAGLIAKIVNSIAILFKITCIYVRTQVTFPICSPLLLVIINKTVGNDSGV